MTVAYTLDVVRAVLSRGLYRNVVVLLKVNPSVTAGEQLTTGQQSRRDKVLVSLMFKDDQLFTIITLLSKSKLHVFEYSLYYYSVFIIIYLSKDYDVRQQMCVWEFCYCRII